MKARFNLFAPANLLTRGHRPECIYARVGPSHDPSCRLQGEGLTLTDLRCVSNELDDLLLPYNIDLSLFESLQEPALLAHIARVGVELFSRSQEGAADFES